MLIPAGLSLFGKLPCAADYLRIAHTHADAQQLDRWLSAGVQALARASADWPAQRVQFVFACAGGETLLAGVLAPSRDRAGRRFPVAIYGVLAARVIGAAYAALPGWLDAYWRAIHALLDRSSELTRESLAHALSALRTPSPRELASAQAALHRALANESAAAFFRGTLGADSGVQSCALACTRVTQRAAIECPLRHAADVASWLALLTHAGHALPSLFWTHEPQRLLLAFGAPAAELPLWLARPQLKAPRLLDLRQLAPAGTPDPSSLLLSLIHI